jgi:hypothetical protein
MSIQNDQGLQNVLNDLVGGFVVKFSLAQTENFTSFKKLHHQVKRVLTLMDFDQIDDVWMVNSLHDLDLIDEGFSTVILTSQVFLGEGFDSEFFTVAVSLE